MCVDAQRNRTTSTHREFEEHRASESSREANEGIPGQDSRERHHGVQNISRTLVPRPEVASHESTSHELVTFFNVVDRLRRGHNLWRRKVIRPDWRNSGLREGDDSMRQPTRQVSWWTVAESWPDILFFWCVIHRCLIPKRRSSSKRCTVLMWRMMKVWVFQPVPEQTTYATNAHDQNEDDTNDDDDDALIILSQLIDS